MRESIVSTNAAVLPVPDCDWPIMLRGGFCSSSGSARSWILDGLVNFIE